MAFLLLAANARDDTLLLLEQQVRRRQKQKQQKGRVVSNNNKHNESNNNHQTNHNNKKRTEKSKEDSNDNINNNNDELGGEEDDDDDSCHSLPWDWGTSPPVAGLAADSSNNDHAKHHHHRHLRHHYKSSFWNNTKSLFSLKSYLSSMATTTTTTMNHKSSSNMKDHSTWRQRRLVRHAAKEIQSAVEERLRESPFLTYCHQLEQQAQQQEQGNNNTSNDNEESRISVTPTTTADDNDNDHDLLPPLAVVSRNDIHIRYWLGRGGFCEVYEIDPIAIEQEDEDYDGINTNTTTKVVLKHLSPSLLPNHHHHHNSSSLFPINHNNKKVPTPSSSSSPSSSSMNNFILGAIDLRMEALYLSQLSSSPHDHPNIIELRGVVQPTQGLPYGDGHYDGFGLLLEPLEDTLDQRLENWKREMKHQTTTSNDMMMMMMMRNNNHDESSSSDQQLLHLKKVLNYASQIADALDYLHERRIILCDVKPSNVGFSDDDTVKLFDFGLARELPQRDDDDDDDERRLYTLPVAGTPMYLPPEALVQRKYNCLRDVYSWSMVLYEMISFHQPYEDLLVGGKEEHYQRVAKDGERPPLDMMIPIQLHSLLQHSWVSDVTKRYTMQQARKELEKVRIDMGLLSLSSSSSSCCSSKEEPQEVVVPPPPPTTTVKHHPHHHRRKSSMDSLLNGRNSGGGVTTTTVADPAGSTAGSDDDVPEAAEDEPADQDENNLKDDNDALGECLVEENKNKGGVPIASSMTAEDFESYFLADHHHQRFSSSSSNQTTWKKALALPTIGLKKKRLI